MADNTPPLVINAPVILLVGLTGAGKSTLGNLLLKTSKSENPTFTVSDNFTSVTKKSTYMSYKIGGNFYNIIDTPGIFDTDDFAEVTLEDIARTIKKCTHGIKAILFVIEAKRFTNEQREIINKIKLLLGEESLQYMIAVFSHCNKKQTKDPDYFIESCWNDPIRAFVNSVGGRWAISPDAENFPPDNLIHKKRLQQLKNHITSLDGTYTFDILEKARKEREENERKARKAEEKRRREHDEILKREGEEIARANYEYDSNDENRNKAIINTIWKKIGSTIYQTFTKF